MLNFRFSKHLFFLLALSFPFVISAEPSFDDGKKVFKNYCGTCHNKSMLARSTGPALYGAEERWADYPREDLYKWIRNSQALIAEGHPRAVELWNEWNSVMNPFPQLTDDDIENVLFYIRDVVENPPVVVNGGPTTNETESKGLGDWVYWALLFALGFLVLILGRIISNLNKIAAAKEGSFAESKTLTQLLTSKGAIMFLIFAGVILGGYTTVNNSVNLGRQQGYAPEQPIKFSHEIHAGIHKIDCQYCHDGARRSKHAVIPATNTCMNCHRAITSGTTHGTAEITKIFASAGFDPNTNKYIDNPESVPMDTLAAIYKKWIGDQYLFKNELEELDNEGENIVETQWADIVSSLTNDQKKSIVGPIEWERIHNLPDHVYFNHSQHVAVGGVECESCHGKMEEMEVAEQYAPLSMGWCINCHRETDVQFDGNEYYESYAKYHEELKEGDRKSVKVSDIGGLECQKCHY